MTAITRQKSYLSTYELDVFHYTIEDINTNEELEDVDKKLEELQQHLIRQREKIKRINTFDCDKVKELPKEIVNLIESFMYDDIDTVCKAYRIFTLFPYPLDKKPPKTFERHYKTIPISWYNGYFHNMIFKKYKKEKVLHIARNMLPYHINKSVKKYQLVDKLFTLFEDTIYNFDWNKGLAYQTNYNYNIRPFNDDNRVLDKQYKVYQIFMLLRKSNSH
jgi:hypothetical protein